MSAIRKDCPSEKSAIARAIDIAGGTNALASTTGFAPSAVKRWLGAGAVDSHPAAAAVEDATNVPVEELMPGAHWLRANDGELLGVALPLNGADSDYLRARLAECGGDSARFSLNAEINKDGWAHALSDRDDWRNILIYPGYGNGMPIDRLEAIRSAAECLSEVLLDGIAAICDMQWAISAGDHSGMLDKDTLRNANTLIKESAILTRSLNLMEANASYSMALHKKEPDAAR